MISLYFIIDKVGFQNDSGWMVLSANEERTERASANHSVASKYQFETPSDEFQKNPRVSPFQR